MKARRKNVWMMLLVTLILSVGLLVLNGCKKTEPAPPPTTMGTMQEHEGHEGHEHPATTQETATSVAAGEQAICPVMGLAIDKNIFVEYQGKKVYFCCPECKPKFEAEPAKYVAKLPQFKN